MRPSTLRFGVFVLCSTASFSSAALLAPRAAPGDDTEKEGKPTVRDGWIKSFGRKSLEGSFFGRITPEGHVDSDVVPIKFVITTSANDEDVEPGQFPGMIGSRASWYGVDVANDWRIHRFSRSSRGTKGFGGSSLSESDAKRLADLIANLTKDELSLPPPGRRVLIQVAEGDHYVPHIY